MMTPKQKFTTKSKELAAIRVKDGQMSPRNIVDSFKKRACCKLSVYCIY
jgi:hypothetical protein